MSPSVLLKSPLCVLTKLVMESFVVVQSLSHVQPFVTPWTITCQAPLSMGFPRQEFWSGLPFPSPGDLPHPGIESHLLQWHLDSLPLSYQESLSQGKSDPIQANHVNLCHKAKNLLAKHRTIKE